MKKQITIVLALLCCFSAQSLLAGKPVADTAVFSAELSGLVNGFWTSKEYKISDRTTSIVFNKQGGTQYLYFTDAFIHEFDNVSPGSNSHELSAGHQCFGQGNAANDFLGGTAHVNQMGFGKDSDLVMSLWFHAPNSNPNDNEEIFYVLDLYNTSEPAWDPSFPPDSYGSVNSATSWKMRTTSNSYLKLEPCIGSGDSFPGGASLEIEIKRLP